MNCDHATRVLDAGVDGELDPATDAELAAHLAGCPACATLRVERESLREAIRQAPRHAASPQLRKAIRASLARHDGPATPRPRRGLSWASAGAVAVCAAAAAFALGWWAAAPVPASDERDASIDRHVAALAQRGRLLDVAASDRHVVKPWFAGKIDFAPPVPDLADAGFVLLGGRLDRVADRPAAVIVYRIREHDIDLFVSRSAAPGPQPLEVSRPRGFAIATWGEDGLVFTAVSDVDPKELARFAALVRAPGR